jgi:hypothetical protein
MLIYTRLSCMRIRIAGLIIILAAIFNSLAAATHEMLPHCTCRFSCLSARQIAWLIGWNSLNHWESDRDAAKVINVCCWWRTDDWRLHFVRERERPVDPHAAANADLLGASAGATRTDRSLILFLLLADYDEIVRFCQCFEISLLLILDTKLSIHIVLP